MAFDGVVVAAVTHELNACLRDGRIDKIYQPEKDEIILTVRAQGANYRLLLSANPSYPRLHLTQSARENPLAPPMFCMVLRKHLSGGRIVRFEQPDFERIVRIGIEALNEMGDRAEKTLIIEIMGKHSNIILVDEHGIILDSAKHVPRGTSSVRQVLPGREYESAPDQKKTNPLALIDGGGGAHNALYGAAHKAVYQAYRGISPALAIEICYRAGVEPDEEICEADAPKLMDCLADVMKSVARADFVPEIVFDGAGEPKGFFVTRNRFIGDLRRQQYSGTSEMLEMFYSSRDTSNRARQKSADLRKLVGNLIDRCVKKADIQRKTLEEIEDRDELRLFGDLITANIYAIERGATSFTCVNFYIEDTPEITIRLDATKTAAENAQTYFKKYAKQKRTFDALQDQISANDMDLAYLETLLLGCDHAADAADLDQIRNELAQGGFIKKRSQKAAKGQKKPKPLHYRSSDGHEIFVGKNNAQNDALTKAAHGNDIWMHTKNIAGSHVIVQAIDGRVSDAALNEAAHLAAYYSKARAGSMVPVDYCLRKHVKKPGGAKPGMVVYEKNKTAFVTPDEDLIKTLAQL